MKALPALKSNLLVGRINDLLDDACQRFIDPRQVNGLSREWHLLGREIKDLFTVDACVAWDLTGAWMGLTGNVDEMESAFKASAALGSDRCNWLVTRLNLGMFSAAQELYLSVGNPDTGHFSRVLGEGYSSGAIAQAAHNIQRARQMNMDWDETAYPDIEKAHNLLKTAGVSDERIAQQLDIAGTILREHGIRPRTAPRATTAAGFFEGVTYSLIVPVSAEEAFDMNVELAMREDEAGIEKSVAFDVVFEAASA